MKEGREAGNPATTHDPSVKGWVGNIGKKEAGINPGQIKLKGWL